MSCARARSACGLPPPGLARPPWSRRAALPTSLRTRFRSCLAALSRCRAQARRVAHQLMSGWDTGRVAPRLERFGAEEAVRASRDEMTRNGEDVVGGRVQGQEP